jgi:hypothetical protein
MDWRKPTEEALVGLLSHGALAFFFSKDPLVVLLCSLAGAFALGGYAALRPLPWKRMFVRQIGSCVSVFVHPKTGHLQFCEVSQKVPKTAGFIKVFDVDKRDLFLRLKDKQLNPETIPFHIRALLETGGSVELPWYVIQSHLKEA